ncbi:MAG: DUF3786 domain-containing protein [Desulfobacterales bacterium]|nr:DUF3786 domain-containing protein [Desulfobacterales bacterium]
MTDFPGEKTAWEMLNKLNPDVVIKNAGVRYDKIGMQYIVKSFNHDIQVSIKEKSVSTQNPETLALLDSLWEFYPLTVVWYLASSNFLQITGSLISPKEIPGGDIFLKGSHMLPLDDIADRFKNDTPGFIQKGKDLGGTLAKFGDAAITLFPFPAFPVTLVLWEKDDEFPARVDILFDSSCKQQFPADIIWSTGMMCALLVK